MNTLLSTRPALTALLLLGLAAPAAAQPATPEQFAPGVLNTNVDEYGPTFTPDGRTMYFTLRRDRRGNERIVVSRLEGDAWTAPETAPFSGGGYDKEPYLSPDGSKLFFASKRRVGGADLDFELWVVERTSSGWGEPRHLAEVGSPAYENYPAVAANGNLYFGSARETGRGRLFRARWTGSAYAEPEELTSGGAPISGADPYIDPQERFMIFSSTRDGGYGEGDLYVTYHRDGAWTEPTNLGEVINTADYEYTPFIAPDGRTFYFSRGWGEMYRIALSALGLEY